MYTIPNLPPSGSSSDSDSDGSGQIEDITTSLQGFFDGAGEVDMAEVATKLEDHFKKSLSQLGKQLIADHASEKRGFIGVHTFHGFDAAMTAAFPGWPEHADEYYKFRGHVFFRKGGGVILGNKVAVLATFKRFTDALWPNQQVPDDKFWPLLKTIAEGVKYCRKDYAERKYRAEVGPLIKRRGKIFDSKKLYEQKIEGRYISGGVAPSKDSMKCRCLWVMSWPEGGEPAFYTHIGKLARFHHSSFKAGEAIMAGGEWVIDNGKLTHINACSGHYKPEAWRFLTACTYLKNKGVITDKTELEVWKGGTQRELVKCLPFLKDLSRKQQNGYQLYKG